MHRHVLTTLFVVCTALAWTNPSAADVVTDWNQTILATAGAAAPAGRGATPASLIDIATVHLAMHDAAQAYDKRFESYAGVIPGASGSSIVAVAKAAHDVLANRFPMQAGALGTSTAHISAAWCRCLLPGRSPTEKRSDDRPPSM